MELFFSPLACSMASRIALYEAGLDARFVEVDPKTKRTLDGQDYRAVNPLGLVPALRLDDGSTLFENAAILQWIGTLAPEGQLVPNSAREQAALRQWLSFIGTELHKALFVPLFDPALPGATRDKTITTGDTRLRYLNDHLAKQDYLLASFSVADAYLVTVLNWHIATPVDLKRWPAIAAYFDRIKARPAVERAMKEEFALYAEEQKRHKAA